MKVTDVQYIELVDGFIEAFRGAQRKLLKSPTKEEDIGAIQYNMGAINALSLLRAEMTNRQTIDKHFKSVKKQENQDGKQNQKHQAR